MSAVRIRVAPMRTGRWAVCVSLGGVNFFKTASDEFHASLLALEVQGFCERVLRIDFAFPATPELPPDVAAEWESEQRVLDDGIAAINDLLEARMMLATVTSGELPVLDRTYEALRRLRDQLRTPE